MTMKPAQTSIISIHRDQFIIHMSIVQKQSDTGLLFNERLFILQQGLFFGYISKFDIKENPQNIDLRKVKSKILTKFIKSVTYDKENLTIKFLQIQNNKQQLKKWVFKMASSEMIVDWYRILQQEKTRKNSKSQQKLNLSPRKYEKTNDKEIQKQKPEQKRFQQNQQKKQEKNQHKEPQQIFEQESNQNRQFVNPLYTGYESIDSGPTRNAVKNSKVLQTPRSGLNLQPEQKRIYDEPIRQNNHMQQNFKKNQQIVYQIQQRNKDQYDENRRKLQFKNDALTDDKLKYDKQHQRNSSFEDRKSENKPKRQSYVEMIQKIVKQSQQRAAQKYKQRALQKQYEGNQQNREHFYNNVLEEFIRYEPGETVRWKQQNLKKFQIDSNSKSNSEIEVFQQHVLNILHKQRENRRQQKNSQVKLNDFSKQIAEMIKKKRLGKQVPQKNIEQDIDDNEELIDIKSMPFSYRYLLATSPYIPIQQRQQDQLNVLHDWKIHCDRLMKKIILDIASNGGKYPIKNKKNNILYFQVDETIVKIACSSLKTITFNPKQSKKSAQNNVNKKQEKITDYSAAKDLQIEFKNYSALNSILERTQNQEKRQKQLTNQAAPQNQSSRLKVPLSAIVQYSGFMGLFILKVKTQKDNKNIDLKNLKQKQQQVSQQINIQLNWFQNINKKYNFENQNQPDENTSTKTLISHIDENYYIQLHTGRYKRKNKLMKSSNVKEKNTNNKFCVDIIQQVGPLMIRDYLTKSLSNGVLRKQLMQHIKEKDQYRSVKFINPTSITNIAQRSKTEADLTLLSGQILQKLSHLIIKLDSLEANYMHPSQISSHFHQLGINIRYMGLAYDNLNEIYAKKNLMTQIAARVVKLILRKTLQDIVLENQHKKRQLFSYKKSSYQLQKIGSQEQNNQQILSTEQLCADVIDFLNCIMGSSHQSEILWKLLSQHAQFYFKCQLNKELIDPGYFILSLAHHCKFKINWKNLPQIHQTMFKTQQFFNTSSIIGLKSYTKTYSPANSKVISTLKQIITPQLNKIHQPISQQQIFNQIVQKLQLKINPFPPGLQCFENESSFSILSLKQLLSQFIRPQTIKLSKSQSNFSHLRIFKDLNQFPQTKSFHIKIAQIKWYLKLRNKQKYLKKFQELINILNKFYGDFSPALSEVYEIFTQFHLQNGEYEDAITFCKSSLVNTMKICGVNHIKTGEAYFNLALCYLKANKTQDAYGLLKKAKEVYESKQKITTHNYAIINLKLGLLLLNKNQVKKSLQSIKKSLQVLNTLSPIQQNNRGYDTVSQSNLLYEDEKVECYETLLRCYQVSKDIQGLKKLSQTIQQSILYNIKQVKNLQKILRVILFPYLQSLIPQDKAKYIEMISYLSGIINSFQMTPKSYNKVLSLIKKRISQKSLINNFENYVDNLSSIFDYIEINNSLENWKPFDQEFQRQTINDFVAITEELILFLGEGYLTGALRDSLQH